MSQQPTASASTARRWTVAACLACVVAMGGLAYAAVPLYRLFCQVTGYGGTTQAAAEAPGEVLERTITVRFDANTARGIGWRFAPAQRQTTVRLGESRLAFYTASSPSARRTTGTATFNVTPQRAGAYFNKLDCFCFTEQTLEPGESVEMPVSFFIDPAIDEDAELKGIKTITLSYTFFPVEQKTAATRPAAGAGSSTE